MAAIKPITGVCSIGPNGVMTLRIGAFETEPDPEEPDMTNFFFSVIDASPPSPFGSRNWTGYVNLPLDVSLWQLAQLLSDN